MTSKRVRIGALFPGVSVNPIVAGVVIASQDPKEFSKDGRSDRWVVNFTIRDSPYDTANVSCWGSYQFIHGISSILQLGAVVSLTNVKLTPSGQGEQYRPRVTCGSGLTISESNGKVDLCDASSPLLGYGMYEALAELVYIPNGSAPETLTVADIRNGSQKLSGQPANLLVVVQKIGEERRFRTRDGREATRLEVTCFDQTGFNLCICFWDSCHIKLAKSWTEFETVLFVADAVLKWDSFKNCLIVQMSSRTICTVQPRCEEARHLEEFARSASCLPEDVVDEPTRFEPDYDTDLSKITDIYNIRQLKEAMPSIAKSRKLDGVSYCFFSEFDVDSEMASPLTASCGVCRTRITDFRRGFYTCPIPDCKGSTAKAHHNLKFDIRVTLSDASGSLASCKLTGVAAERTLGITAEDFLSLSVHERTALKWQFLLERSKVYLTAIPRKIDQSAANVWILHASRASLDEVAARCSAA